MSDHEQPDVSLAAVNLFPGVLPHVADGASERLEPMEDVLDSISGALERAVEGREQAQRGEVIPLEDL